MENYIEIPILKIVISILNSPAWERISNIAIFPGALEIMVLQSLRLRPMHGYALVKHIKQRERIQERIEELMEEGMARREAEQTARREFGNVPLIKGAAAKYGSGEGWSRLRWT